MKRRLSDRDLPGDAQRLFRRLSLHPGLEIDGYAAAALDGSGLADAYRGRRRLRPTTAAPRWIDC